MIYYIIFFIGILACEGTGGSMLFDNKKGFKYPYLILFVLFILLFGLRHMTVAGDTVAYVGNFLGKADLKRGFLGIFSDEYEEPLYILSMVVLESLTSNYTVFLIVFSLPFCIGVAKFVKEESEDYFITTILLCTLGIVHFCMAGLRQAIAMGICLISYKYVKQRRLIPFLICILLSYGFHNSSLIFILAYPLYNLKTSSFYFILVAICFVLGYIKSGIIKQIGLFFTEDGSYGNYFLVEDNGLNYTGYIIQLAITIFCFLYKDKICEENKSAHFLFNMAILGLCIQGFSGVVSEFFRLSMYFSVFLAVLVPKAILAEKNTQVRWLEFFLIIAVCIVYIFYLNGAASNYMMFWSK